MATFPISGPGLSYSGNSLYINTANTITIVNSKVQLVNDQGSPGANKYYGTNSVGTKGYYEISVSGLATTNSLTATGAIFVNRTNSLGGNLTASGVRICNLINSASGVLSSQIKSLIEATGFLNNKNVIIPEIVDGENSSITLSLVNSLDVDNQPAIQAAFDANFSIVNLPAGDYGIKNPISIPHGVYLRGAGEGLTRLHSYDCLTIKAWGTWPNDLFSPIRISDISFFGGPLTPGFISISEIYRCSVRNCTFWDAINGFGVELRNRKYWTEGTFIDSCHFRDCKDSVITVVDDPLIDGIRSFAETRIFNCSCVMIQSNCTFLNVGPNSYLYAGRIECKLNLAPNNGNDKQCIIKVGEAAAVLDVDWSVKAELQGNFPFWRFYLDYNSGVNGIGEVVIMPHSSMSRSLNAANPYDFIQLGSTFYISPNGRMCSGTGVSINSQPSWLGAGQPVFAQFDVFSDINNLAALYLTDGVFEITARYAGLGRSNSVTLRVSTNKDANDSASSSDVKIVTIQSSYGKNVFNAIKLRFSQVNQCPYLFFDMINTVPNGVLSLVVELKSFSSGDEKIITDFTCRSPLVFFPTAPVMGAMVVVAHS